MDKLEAVKQEVDSWCENCVEPCGDCMLGKIKKILSSKFNGKRALKRINEGR